MKLVLGVDSSTTSCKVIAWSPEGQAVAEGRASLSYTCPEPDAYEQDARRYWSALVEATRAAVEALGERAADVAAVCIAHQRETFVLADERGEPLAPAVLWMDARCVEDVRAASDALGAAWLHEETGKYPCTTPSFYKLLERLRRRPELREARPYVLDVQGFLAWKLVGRPVTSLASADPMGLIDMRGRGYSARVLAHAGVTPERLAALVEPGATLGALGGEAARELGLRAGLPVVAGAGDGQAAGLGAALGERQAYLNLGTAVVCGRTGREYRVSRGYRTLFAATAGSHFFEGDLKAGTFLLTWLTGRLLGKTAEEQGGEIRRLDAEAARLAPGADGLLLLPYWNGVMNPHWDDDASGVVAGWRGHHGPAHLYRAILEGLAMEVRLHLEGLEEAGPIDELVVMGGGAQSDLFCQIVADVTGRRVVRCATVEVTSLGAGALAAAAVGLHGSAGEAARAMTSRGASFVPGEDRPFHDDLYGVYRGLYPALAASMARLAEVRRGGRR